MSISKADMTAAIPALLLCAVTLIMLLLDVMIPSMSEKQYVLYPFLIRITSLAALICVFLQIRSGMEADSKGFAAKTVKSGLGANAGSICFAAFLTLAVISTLINGFNRDALLGVPYRYIGLFDIFTLVIGYMMCSSRMSGKEIRKKVILMFAAVSDLVAVVFTADWYLGFIDAFGNKNEPAAIFFHGNHYGYFLVVSVIISAGLCLYGGRRETVFGAVSLALQLFVLAINRSIGCILAVGAVFAAAIVWLLIRGSVPRIKIIIPLAVALAMVSIALTLSVALRDDMKLLFDETMRIITGVNDEYAGHGRLALWQLTVDLIGERPFFGFGCEGISNILYESTGVGSPHNEVMTYAAFFGIPAACFYTAGVVITLLRGLRSRDCACRIAAAAATGYFISSLFGVAMFYTAPFFFVLLGLALSGARLHY